MTATTRLTTGGRIRRCQPRNHFNRTGQAGLTIVELILVLVIVSVLGALAGPRFFNDRDFEARGYAEELAVALRYAQKLAIGSGCPVRVQVTGTTYALNQQAPLAGHCDPADTTFPVPVLLPSGQAASGTAPDGVTAAPATSFVIDALGRTSLAADITLTVGPHAVAVDARSGLVRGPQ